MKYILELTEDQMNAVRLAIADAGSSANLHEAHLVLRRAAVVPNDCACALGPVGDDLCPVHDADIDVEVEADFKSNHHPGKAT